MTERRTRLAAWTNINNSCNPKVLTPGSQCRATMSSRTTGSLVHRPRPQAGYTPGATMATSRVPHWIAKNPYLIVPLTSASTAPWKFRMHHNGAAQFDVVIRRCNNGAAETCDGHLHLSRQQMSERTRDKIRG